MSTHRFTLTVGAADVVGVLHLPDELPSPCVIACHGMGASKDSDKYLALGRELPAAGLAELVAREAGHLLVVEIVLHAGAQVESLVAGIAAALRV